MARNEKLVIESYETMMNNRRVPRGILRHADVLIGVIFIILPFVTMGAYFKISLIGAGIGTVFMIAQRIIYKDPKTYADKQPDEKQKRTCMIIRCTALILLLLDLFIVLGAGSGAGFAYPARKALYSFANFSDGSSFEFMPDSLPEKTDKLEMRFVPPTAGQDADGHINITFYTDNKGTAQLKEQALDKGGTLCATDSFEYKKLVTFCEGRGLECKGSEVYLFGKTGKHCSTYLINEQSGLCVIYW